MKRNQVVFFLIIGLAIVIVGVGLALQNGDSSSPNNSPQTVATAVVNAPPITLEVAVSPLAQAWVNAAAAEYNRSNPSQNGRLVTVRVTNQDSIAVWTSARPYWTAENHPDAWIPEAAYVLSYAAQANLPFETAQNSLAQSPVVWGAFETRSRVIETEYGSFSSNAIQQAVQANSWFDLAGGNQQWGFVKLGFARPNSIGGGFASLLTLMGEHEQASQITHNPSQDAALRDWLTPLIDAVPNFAGLGADPAATIATRGTSMADIGLLPESQWLMNMANFRESIFLHYPEYYLLLDFPYAVWSGEGGESAVRQAAVAFGEYLRSAEGARFAGLNGLRPAGVRDLTQYAPFAAAGDTLQDQLSGTAITPPNRDTARSILDWFARYRPAS